MPDILDMRNMSCIYCSMKNQVHLIGKRRKESELKCRVVMEAALNILLTMALHPIMLKRKPKAGQYEKIFVFSFLC